MTDSSILAEMKPCGLILASHLYKFFALQCIYCNNKYGHWATFMRHLKETHREQAEESHWLKNVFHKEEQLEIVSEVEPVEIAENQLKCADNICIDVARASPALSCDVVEIVELLGDQVITEEAIYEELEEPSSGDVDAAKIAIEADTLPVQFEAVESNDAVVSDDYVEQLSHDAGSSSDEAVITAQEFQLNFTVADDATTLLFIKLYKCYPCLWQLYQSRSSQLQQRAKAKKELLKSLSEHNFIVSMGDVEHSILELHKYFDAMSRRLEEGLEISNVADKYYEECGFLKPFSSFPVTRKGSIETRECNNSAAAPHTDMIDEDSNAVDGSQYSSTCIDYSDSDEDDNDTANGSKLLVCFSRRNKATCDFIQCFRAHPCLWNPQDAAYGDMEERIQALTEIRDFFVVNHKANFTEYSLRVAIKRLLTFYKRCYHSKRNLSSIRGFYYERCDFLASIDLDGTVATKSNPVKKITFESLNNYTLDFIDLCAKYPMLWDYRHADYSVQKARQIAYQEMAAQIQQVHALELSKDELYDSIYKTKHCYYRLQEKKRRNKPLTRSDLIYLERGKFLPPCKSKVQCDICERVLRSELTLQIHLLKEHNIGELPFKCNYCEQRFAHRTTMKEHEVRTHTKQFDWLCQYCKKGFASRRDKQQHEMVHTGVRSCICEHCGKSFRLKHQMTEHVKIVHERIRRFKCTMCPKDFLRKNHLNDHISSHLNIRDKVCGICGKTFMSFNALFRHKQIHSDVKRYECKVCGERFHQYVGMSTHMKRRHALVKTGNSVEGKHTELTGLMDEHEELDIINV